MAVPKRKTSKRRTKNRRAANMKVKPVLLTKCPKCGEPKRAHVVCTFCGEYKGKKILNVESKLDKKVKREKKRAEKEAKTSPEESSK